MVWRLCNLSDGSFAAPLVFGREVAAAWRANLLECRDEPLTVAHDDGGAPCRLLPVLRPHGIATVEVEFAE